MHNNPNPSNWPAEHVDRLVQLHAAEHSAAEIAAMMTAEFGVVRTRNSILGKCHRLGITRSAREENKRRARATRAKQATKPDRNAPPTLAPSPLIPAGLVLTDDGIRYQRARRDPTPLPVCDAVEGGVTFDRLTGELDHFCRWIPGDPNGAETVYCGNPKAAGSSYCQHHKDRSLQGGPLPRVMSPAYTRRAA